ncbi:MAG TPA: hypothetical protein VFS59_19665 [Gemmatimonadaceae bacterium]|nr:hypothetical protein [Gemmatimonadaceae bacterium]
MAGIGEAARQAVATEVTARRRTVVVDGDVTLDWNVACGQDAGGSSACAYRQAGGAALLGELVGAVVDAPTDDGAMAVDVEAPAAPNADPMDARFHHRFVIWRRYEDAGGANAAWRVERFLGTERAAAGPVGARGAAVAERADLVVLHDAGLGFRDDPARWPAVIRTLADEPPWVVLRMAKPVARGALWKHLEPFAERAVVVIHIDDLRLGAVHVTRELSWERTAQDLVDELRGNPGVSPLARCAHLVVSFTTAGALVCSREPGASEPRARLVYDPAVMERMWNEAHPGGMIGGVTALTASVARQLLLNPDDPDVLLGVQRGVAAMRALDLGGYDALARDADRPADVRVVYPVARMVEELTAGERPFAEADACGPGQAEARADGHVWTILEDRYPRDLETHATRIVHEGPERALPDVPIGRFGELLTFDRLEIEGLQSVRTLIRQYADRDRATAPLSLAVFGPPGAGKSWSVKQVAKAVLPGRVRPLTFNLSQFDDPRELIDALHRVRDIALRGELPLVFWDEFDTARVTVGGRQPLGWLAHFLSPMQDGEFQDGQLTHPIGQSVFVFGGGSYERMDAFVADSAELRQVKAPDFVSRLNGYVNVVGPNPRGEDDAYYLIRRAVLVRSVLEQHAPGIFRQEDGVRRPEIDPGILHALLLTREYRHGARSLSSIVATSVGPGRDRFERSDLASEPQLDLHVDAQDFLALVHSHAASA